MTVKKLHDTAASRSCAALHAVSDAQGRASFFLFLLILLFKSRTFPEKREFQEFRGSLRVPCDHAVGDVFEVVWCSTVVSTAKSQWVFSLTSLLTVYLYTHSFHWTTNLWRCRIAVAPPSLTYVLYLTFLLSYLTAPKSGNLLWRTSLDGSCIPGGHHWHLSGHKWLQDWIWGAFVIFRRCWEMRFLKADHAPCSLNSLWHLNTLRSWRKLFFHALSWECSQHPR